MELNKLKDQKGYVMVLSKDDKHHYNCFECNELVAKTFYYCYKRDRYICAKCEKTKHKTCVNMFDLKPDEEHNHFFIVNIETKP